MRNRHSSQGSKERWLWEPFPRWSTGARGVGEAKDESKIGSDAKTDASDPGGGAVGVIKMTGLVLVVSSLWIKSVADASRQWDWWA